MAPAGAAPEKHIKAMTLYQSISGFWGDIWPCSFRSDASNILLFSFFFFSFPKGESDGFPGIFVLEFNLTFLRLAKEGTKIFFDNLNKERGKNSSSQTIYVKLNHILGYKESLTKYQETGISQIMPTTKLQLQ